MPTLINVVTFSIICIIIMCLVLFILTRPVEMNFKVERPSYETNLVFLKFVSHNLLMGFGGKKLSKFGAFLAILRQSESILSLFYMKQVASFDRAMAAHCP